jgi:hypothetical protein
MSEGFILTIEACPYAFSTDGVTGITPVHPEWAPSWTLIDGVLQNPTDYVSWNERILPIEGDLEVDSITFKMFDKRVENIVWYDPNYQAPDLAQGRFSGNLLTELFARGTPRNSQYFLVNTLVSASVTDPNTRPLYEELQLVDTTFDALVPVVNTSHTGITGSLQMPGLSAGPYYAWVEDEVVSIVGTSGNISQIGVSVGVEDEAGRGLFGTVRKYHVPTPDYRPEIFLKHPYVNKRGVILWRVSNSDDLNTTSIFPIWRGFVQSNPQTSDDGVMFYLSCNHKWQVYRNEPITFRSFDKSYSIKAKQYSPLALQVWYHSNLRREIKPDLSHFTNTVSSDPRTKYRSDPRAAFRARNAAGTTEAILQAINEPSSRLQVRFSGDDARTNKVTVIYDADEPDPGIIKIGTFIAGKSTWGNTVTDPDRNDFTAVYDQDLPETAVDYILNSPYNIWPVTVTNSLEALVPPATYYESGRGGITVRQMFVGFDQEAGYKLYFIPRGNQSAYGARDAGFVIGNIVARMENGVAVTPTDRSIRFITKPLELSTRLLIKAPDSRTTIEALTTVFFNTQNSTNLFPSVNQNDFDVTNVVELRDWVSEFDNRGTELVLGPEVKFGEFLTQYTKFYNYVFGLKGSKIRIKPYDLLADQSSADHTLTSADLLQVPSLKQLPENLFNTAKYKLANYETEYVFQDANSKGRYKTGNTQDFELSSPIQGISSPLQLAQFLGEVAKRFLTVWGYPQYLVNLKTSLSKIYMEVGDTVNISEYVLPNFDPVTPGRSLANQKGFIIERNVDLTTGELTFGIVFTEKAGIKPYSPCGRVEEIEIDTPVVGQSRITLLPNFIQPINKFEPTGPTTVSTSNETSDYVGSNRFVARPRYGQATEDAGTSPFLPGDAVELILRDDSTGNTYHSGMKVVSSDPATRRIVVDVVIPAPWPAHVTGGDIVDLRFADYDAAATTAMQREEWAWIGDTVFESLDNPLPTPPATRTIAGSQFSF